MSSSPPRIGTAALALITGLHRRQYHGGGVVGYRHDPSGTVLGIVILVLSLGTLAIALRARSGALAVQR